MMLWKCCPQYASKFGKLRSGHRTGKDPFSLQCQRKAMPKLFKLLHNCTFLTPWQGNAQNSPSQASTVHEAVNFQMFKLILEMAEELEIKLPTSVRSSKKWEFQKNIYFCFIDYTPVFNCVDHNKPWKILKELGIPDNLICLLRNL